MSVVRGRPWAQLSCSPVPSIHIPNGRIAPAPSVHLAFPGWDLRQTPPVLSTRGAADIKVKILAVGTIVSLPRWAAGHRWPCPAQTRRFAPGSHAVHED